MAQTKRIKVFYSAFSQRFYASRAYREVAPGIVEITGQKYDVTNDIAELVLRHGIVFSEKEISAPATTMETKRYE